MPVFILCPSCSNSIGIYYAAYANMRDAIVDQTFKDLNIDINKADFKPDIIPSFEFIFKALGIKKYCCKLHIMTATDFS